MVSHALKILVFSMAAVLLLDSLFGADPQEKTEESKQPVAKQNVILISKETTRITEPLDDEGYVDYVEALNDLYSAGVTPENNFEVVVRQVMPPNEISEPDRKEYFSRLGMPVPEPDARFYQDFYTFTLAEINNPARVQEIDDEYDQILSEPWTAAEHPHAAKWVAQYGTELDQLVEGSKRSRFYTPYLAGDDPNNAPTPRVIAILLGSVQQQREVARGLSIRAMGRIGAGDLDGAWSDLQAMHRVAHHVAEGFTLIESLVGYAIEAMTFYAEVHVLNSPHLTAEQNRRFLADLRALKPPTPVADKLDRGERFMGLDVVTVLARNTNKHGLLKMLELINDLSDATDQSPFTFFVAAQNDAPVKVDRTVGLIDWNMTMLTMNQWYDRLVATAREPDFEQRKILFAKLNRELEQLKEEVSARTNPLDAIAQAGPRQAKGRVIGKILVALLLPACQHVRIAEDMHIARREVIQLAFAAELSRRENGQLPESLRSLVPKYVSAIRDDPLSGKPLKYQPQKHGFLVYSVGRNGKDDNGLSWKDHVQGVQADWDDIVVRVHH